MIRGQNPADTWKIALGGALLAVVLVTAGCARAPRKLDHSPTTVTAGDFKKSVRTWSEAKENYEFYGRSALFAATFYSVYFRRTLVKRIAKLYKMTAAEEQQLLAQHMESDRRHYTFFVCARVAPVKYNDLDSKDTRWRIRLINDQGHELEPVAIKRVKTRDPLYDVLFPCFQTLTEGYLIDFAKTEGFLVPSAKRFALRFTGPIAAADLVWKLD